MSDYASEVPPVTLPPPKSAFAYLSLADDPTVMTVMRSAQAIMQDAGIEWQPSPTLHVTLVFATAVDDETLTQIARTIHLPSELYIEFDGIGVFENEGTRAMHIQVRHSESLAVIQEQVYRAFETHGLMLSAFSEPSQWKAHITLAYLPPGIAVADFPYQLATAASAIHIGRDDYEPFAEILATRIHFGGVVLEAQAKMYSVENSALRHMLIVSSNAYLDREGEIVTQKALEEYAESCWSGEVFKSDNTLLVWHAGDPIGDIIFADTEGPFLVEVARERPNALINLADEGEEPLKAEIKAVWDALEREKGLGASLAFYPRPGDRKDGIYRRIYKRETSVLPRRAAANLLTDAEIVEVQA